jgi:hypothetical protein
MEGFVARFYGTIRHLQGVNKITYQETQAGLLIITYSVHLQDGNSQCRLLQPFIAPLHTGQTNISYLQRV